MEAKLFGKGGVESERGEERGKRRRPKEKDG